MSRKNLDLHGRRRSVTVAFRMSPEEASLLDAKVAMSGLTKQDYITSRLLNREVKVIPSSRVHRALRDEMKSVYLELRRIYDVSELSPELGEVLSVLANEFAGLNDEQSVVEKNDRQIVGMDRVGGQPLARATADPDRRPPVTM